MSTSKKTPRSNYARRMRYQTDAEYRSRVITNKRLRYQKARMAEGKKVRNCGARILVIGVYGRTRDVRGFPVRMLSFTVKELAAVLGYHAVVVRGWIRDGRFPAPPFIASGFPCHRVYTLKQAEDLVRIMGELHRDTQYLRKANTGIIQRLHEAVD